MRHRLSFFILVIISSITFYSCKKTAPQLPSNKVYETNNDKQNLLAINTELASREDSILAVYINKTDKSFKKNELGFWYKITTTTNGRYFKDRDLCSFHYNLKLLNGKPIINESKEFTIGKKEVIVGIEEGIKILRKGEIATFIIPWYLGYGMLGLENKVPPYTSLICEVEIKD